MQRFKDFKDISNNNILNQKECWTATTNTLQNQDGCPSSAETANRDT